MNSVDALTFFTDPHLNAMRNSHTTTGSRLLLRDRMFHQAMYAVSKRRGPAICLGDLFDRYSNDERSIKEAIELLANTDAVLGGNHDVKNRADSYGSLQLLAEVMGDKIAVGGTFEEPSFCRAEYDVRGKHVQLFFVPHAIHQEAFEHLLDEAAAEAADSDTTNMLLLHCNYDNPFTEGKDTALNLDREKAKTLLSTFDYILLGHEHVARSDFGGRLLILGNTHPLSMGEIDDRYVYHFDGEKFERELIWSKDEHYALIQADELLACEGKMPLTRFQFAFVDVEGEIEAEDAPAYAKALANFWRTNDTLLMVRDKSTRRQAALDFTPGEAARNVDIGAQVTKSLEGTKLAPLWEKYRKQVEGV